jgi:hypothetical protein
MLISSLTSGMYFVIPNSERFNVPLTSPAHVGFPANSEGPKQESPHPPRGA